MRFGLEKEYFIRNADNQLCLARDVEDLPYDEAGYLAEARGRDTDNIRDAVFLLLAEEHRIKQLAKAAGFWLDDTPITKVPRKLLHDATRHYAKGTISYQNLYGFSRHGNSMSERVAGVHVSITSPTKVEWTNEDKQKQSRTIYENFDWPIIFTTLDKAFAKEIKAAKRRPGFYEVKSDGRVEYRSLPANVDLLRVVDVINAAIK